MKKAMAILMTSMLTLAGCSGGGSSKDTSQPQQSNGAAATAAATSAATATPTDTKEKKTVRILAHWDGPNADSYKKYIDEYEKLNPNVHIELQTVPFGDLLKKITTSRLSNDGPDIFHIYSAWLPELTGGKALAQAPQAYGDDIKQGYGANIVESVTTDGQIYGYPTELTLYALNYNKKMFEEAGIKEPPKTWDELLDAAKKLSKSEGGKVTQQGFGVITSWDSGVLHPWMTLLQSNGGSLLSEGNKKAAFNSKEGLETLDLYKKMIDGKMLNPEMSLANASTTGPYMNNFELGKTGMIIMANWWKGALESTMKENFKNVGTAPIPVGPSGSKPTSLFYTWLFSVSAQSKNQEEAWKFLQWVNGAQAEGKSSRQGDWLMGMGIIPSRGSDQTAHKAELQDDPFLKTYVELLKDAKTFPIVKGGAQVTSAMQKQIEKAIFSGTAPADVLKAAETEVNAILAK